MTALLVFVIAKTVEFGLPAFKSLWKTAPNSQQNIIGIWVCFGSAFDLCICEAILILNK